MLKNPKQMTDEDWAQLELEAQEIEKEIEEHKEELDKAMSELPSDYFDRMHDEIMEKIKAKEEEAKIERFLNYIFKEGK